MVPQILQVQLVKIGQYALIAFPSEITTMAGRRLKKTVLDSLSSVGVKYVTISALTNGYAQYVTTKEEYDIQWYEGARYFIFILFYFILFIDFKYFFLSVPTLDLILLLLTNNNMKLLLVTLFKEHKHQQVSFHFFFFFFFFFQ